MSLFMVTTKFPHGLLHSPDLVGKVKAAHEGYRAAAPSFDIVSSYKIDAETTIDFVEAESEDDARKAGIAIANATGTHVKVAPVQTFRSHLRSLRTGK
jgi:hypothetical protein